jgi:metal-sulfur cluster biosynthetic enzyme
MTTPSEQLRREGGRSDLVSDEELLRALNGMGDPEVGIGLVDLGLVAMLDVEAGFVRVGLRITTPRCPFQPYIMLEAHRRLLEVSGVVGVEIVLLNDPPWHPDLMSETAKERIGYVSLGGPTEEVHVPIIHIGHELDDEE